MICPQAATIVAVHRAATDALSAGRGPPHRPRRPGLRPPAADRPRRPAGTSGACSTTSALVQIDSVNVLVRSHELPLFARLGPYPRTLIPDAVAAGELFEYWAHVASHRADRAPAAVALADGGAGRTARGTGTSRSDAPGCSTTCSTRSAPAARSPSATSRAASATRDVVGLGRRQGWRWRTCSPAGSSA